MGIWWFSHLHQSDYHEKITRSYGYEGDVLTGGFYSDAINTHGIMDVLLDNYWSASIYYICSRLAALAGYHRGNWTINEAPGGNGFWCVGGTSNSTYSDKPTQWNHGNLSGGGIYFSVTCGRPNDVWMGSYLSTDSRIIIGLMGLLHINQNIT